MLAKLPDKTVPVPISKLTSPFALVVLLWVSTYTAAPVAVPFSKEILIPI
jgi:hypothetical protein